MTKLLNLMKEFEEDNGFAPRERDIFRSLVFDFTKGRHMHSRQKPKSLDEEVYCGVEYIYDLIRECTDLPPRSFLFRVALFLEDRILIARGMARLAEPAAPPETLPKSEQFIFFLIIVSTVLYLTFTFLT